MHPLIMIINTLVQQILECVTLIPYGKYNIFLIVFFLGGGGAATKGPSPVTGECYANTFCPTTFRPEKMSPHRIYLCLLT
jgi:hypothetical protein